MFGDFQNEYILKVYIVRWSIIRELSSIWYESPNNIYHKWIQNKKYGILNMEYWIYNMEYRIWNIDYDT